jgi:hypothetical protein
MATKPKNDEKEPKFFLELMKKLLINLGHKTSYIRPWAKPRPEKRFLKLGKDQIDILGIFFDAVFIIKWPKVSIFKKNLNNGLRSVLVSSRPDQKRSTPDLNVDTPTFYLPLS